MSYRILRKLQGNEQLNEPIEENDPVDEFSDTSIKKKQFNINRYDLVSEIREIKQGL
jgi:hypothetical protein